MAMTVGELLALIRVDDSGFRRGVDGAERRFDGFSRDVNGRLHDIRGRFVREGDEAGKGLANGIGKGATASVGKLLGVGKAIGKGLKFAGIVVGAGQAALSVAHFAAALAPLAGLAAGLPVAMVAGAGALAAFKIGLSGVADAIKGDEEALKKLAPQARSVVNEVRGLDGAWQGVKNTVQGAMFAPLQGQITALAGAWLPVLKTQLGGIAAEFGLMGKEAAVAARDPGFMASIGSALTWLRQTLAANRGAVGDLIAAFGGIVGAITPVLGVSGGIANMAASFRAWVESAAQSGQLASMWQTAVGVLGQLGGLLSNVGGILQSVFSAASASGGDVLGVLGAVLSQVNQFLSSDVGQSALIAVFTGLGQVVDALGPGIQAVLGALGQALTALAPALGPLAGVISQILVALSPLLPVIGQLAAVVAGVLGMALQNLLMIVQPIINALVGALAPILPQLAAAFTQWMTAIAPLAAALGQLLGQALQMILPVILQLVPVLITGLMPAFMAIAQAVLQLFSALMPLIPALLQVVVALMPIIGLVGQLAAKIIGALVPVLLPLINLIVKLAAWLIGKLASALTWVISNGVEPLINALGDFISWLGKVLGKVTSFVADMLSKVGELPGKIKQFFSDAGSWLLQAGKDVVNGLINGIKSMGGAVADAAKNVAKKALDGAKNLLGINSPSRAFADQVGRWIPPGIAVGIKRAQPRLAAQVRSLTDGLAVNPRLSWGAAPALAGGSSTTNHRSVTYDVRIYPQRVDFSLDDFRHEQAKLALRERADRDW